MTKIGKNIKKIRNVKGLSQQSFSELFDLKRGNISSYEESRAEPKIEVMIRIANFFGIPLSDLIEKDLSVNELLHYNSRLVVETEKLKIARYPVNIHYVSAPYINDYVQRYHDTGFLQQLPVITVPCSTKSALIAIEMQDPNDLPAGYALRPGDILIFEQVTKENIHRIAEKLGMMVDDESLKFGIYQVDGDNCVLTLNDWIKYPFDIQSETKYWLHSATYKQA